MKSLGTLLIGALLVAGAVTAAAAGDSWIAVGVQSDREPDDFAIPKMMKYGVEGAHTFDNQLLLQGLAELDEEAGSHELSGLVEATAGYKLRFTNAFSMTGRGGIGERLQSASAGGDFPYYVFYLSADLAITRKVTWNMVSLRYRDAFDTADDFNTPEVGTGLLFEVARHNWISTKLARSWKDGAPDDTEITVGYKYGF